MNEESKNITVGFATLIVFLLAGAFSFSGGQINASTGFTIKGTFNQIDGLTQGDDVRMGGIKIGEISSMNLGEQYTAIVTMRITTAVKIPIDTSAAIHTDGLFGSKFIELEPGSDVRISGITIGTVTDTTLDPKDFDAVVSMTIKPDVKLPINTIASIASGGLIGGKYVRLKPGGAKDFIADGGAIEKTEDFTSLEDQVGEIIFLATGGENAKDGAK